MRVVFTRRTRRHVRKLAALIMIGTAAVIAFGVPLPRVAAVPLCVAVILVTITRA